MTERRFFALLRGLGVESIFRMQLEQTKERTPKKNQALNLTPAQIVARLGG